MGTIMCYNNGRRVSHATKGQGYIDEATTDIVLFSANYPYHAYACETLNIAQPIVFVYTASLRQSRRQRSLMGPS